MIYRLEQFTVYTVESDIPCSLHDGNAFLLYFSPFLLNWWNIHLSFVFSVVHTSDESSLTR